MIKILIVAVFLVETFGVPVAYASGGPSFSMQPVLYDPSNPVTKSYFVFDSRPGTILNNRVRVTNNGTATGSVTLYAVDSTTGQTGGSVYLSQDAGKSDVGAWIKLGVQHLTLAPGQSQIVPFQVVIPQDTWSGQHVGGIVAENMTSNSSSPKSAIQIRIQNLTIIAVQVNLPGTLIEQMTVTGIQADGANHYQTLLVGLDNTGTIMLKPYGNLQVRDAQNHLLQNLPLKLDTFLPHTSINYPVYLKGTALGPGNYVATLSLTYGHGNVLHYRNAFTVTDQQVKQVFKSSPPLQAPWFGASIFDGIPFWMLVLIAFLLASGLFFWGQRLYRLTSQHNYRRKRGKT